MAKNEKFEISIFLDFEQTKLKKTCKFFFPTFLKWIKNPYKLNKIESAES